MLRVYTSLGLCTSLTIASTNLYVMNKENKESSVGYCSFLNTSGNIIHIAGKSMAYGFFFPILMADLMLSKKYFHRHFIPNFNNKTNEQARELLNKYQYLNPLS